MCGIIGIIDFSGNAINKRELIAAREMMAHRGPDDEGIYCYQNIGLGHRRLSVFDPSPQGRQPIVFKEKIIIFNGAIYNHPEIRKTLEGKGYIFHTNTDTEVILAAYHEWGKDCVNHFNGQWAFVIYDKATDMLFCSRDRFGIKPLYYAQIGNRFCIASEIKAFSRIKGWQTDINDQTSYTFLTSGIKNYNEETFFKQVFQVLPGHHLHVNTKTSDFNTEKYYSLPTLINKKITFPEAKKRFKALLSDAVRLRLRSDVKLGASLSGGLDSTSIVSLIAKEHNKTLDCISICFNEKEQNEIAFIEDTINKTGHHSHTHFPDHEAFLEATEKIALSQDEPFATASIFAQYEMFKVAKNQGIKVMISGQGADEILRGYDAFFVPYIKNRFKTNPLKGLYLVFELISQHWPLVYRRLSGFFKNQDLSSKLKGQSIPFELGKWAGNDPALKMFHQTVLPSLLHYEDRNSMAFGIESRLPFLDHRLVEFCFSLPDHFFFDGLLRKRLLREAVKDIIPDSVYLRRDKMAFATPQLKWMQDHKHIYLDFLNQLKPQLQDVVELESINTEEKWNTPNANFIWRLISFGIWHKNN